MWELGAQTLHTVENPSVNHSRLSLYVVPLHLQFLHIRDSISTDSTNCGSFSTVVFAIEKEIQAVVHIHHGILLSH